ncbi:MAG TPA: sulfite exporter TauE/SafE family protein [Gammaproteobacteria bacterium]|nr:sulfite exporter TauE/SafE family protein [Gammaproteobacteria bacterium]
MLLNIYTIVEYLLIGAVAGTFAGMLGVGGSVVVVPALAFVFSAHKIIPANSLMHFVVGTSLAATIVTTLFSLRIQYHKSSLSWDVLFKLIPGIALGVITGAVLARFLHSHVLRVLFGVFIILVSAQTFFRFRESKEQGLPGTVNRWLASLFIGIFSGLLGTSGGPLVIPYLTYFKTPIREAMVVSTACGVVITLVGTVGFMMTGWFDPSIQSVSWNTGYVYWPAVLAIAMGSPLFAALGAAWSYRLPVERLRQFFAAFLLILGLGMLLH